VALSFSGGDGGRSSVVTVECADVVRPQVVRWGNGAAPFSYSALVRARAGCALECARDVATGAVCGGAANGACVFADGTSRCACSEGHVGATCRGQTTLGRSPDTASYLISNNLLSDSHGAAFLVVIASLALIFTLWLRNRTRRSLPQPPLPLSLMLFLLVLCIALAAVLTGNTGVADIASLGCALSALPLLQRPAVTPESPVPSRGRTRPAPADSAENGDWVWTAVYRGNATRPPHLAAQWTSQVGQDRTIADIFDGKRGGFFLDLAANDASVLSNTLMLEQSFGWRGICVEANPG
jgi:hypothetical protein